MFTYIDEVFNFFFILSIFSIPWLAFFEKFICTCQMQACDIWCFTALLYLQVQDKKVKRISVMNLDTSRSSDNGTTSSSSTSSSRGLLPNGGCSEKLCANKDLALPPGGCASLRLPVVVVLKPLYPKSVVLYSVIHN
jgi:hypothetical protein